MKKKLASVGLAAGLLAGTGAGFVLQMAGSAGAASAVTVAVATEDGDSTDRSTRLQEVLQPLIDDGSLTQEQADKVIAALAEAGPIGGGRGGHGGRGHGGMGGGIETVSETLGVTTDELRTAIQDGQTIADIAAANGSSAQAVIDALVAAATTRLDEKVAAGDLTQAEADEKLASMTERITTFVNETPSKPGRGDTTETVDEGS